MNKLRTNRAMWKFILLSVLTFGIYGLVVYCHMSSEINKIASRYDYKTTLHYMLNVLISIVSFAIFDLIWETLFAERIGNELARRNIPYKFGAGHYWGWYIFGTLILVGPFIYWHKLFKAFNLLCEDYNQRG